MSDEIATALARAGDTCAVLSADKDRLAAALVEALEALKPLAILGRAEPPGWAERLPDDWRIAGWDGLRPDGGTEDIVLTLGDARRAWALLDRLTTNAQKQAPGHTG